MQTRSVAVNVSQKLQTSTHINFL